MFVPAGYLFRWCHAALQLLAAGVFELEGCVADLKLFPKQSVELDQDTGAFRRRNVGYGHVAGQGA